MTDSPARRLPWVKEVVWFVFALLLSIPIFAGIALCEHSAGDGSLAFSQVTPGWQRIIDGQYALEYSPWDDDLAVTSKSQKLPIELDLGNARPLAALVLQADWNDSYIVECAVSEGSWLKIWVAPPTGIIEGLVTRSIMLARPEVCRYLRLRAIGGDGVYSISEFRAWSSVPQNWDQIVNPPQVESEWLPWSSTFTAPRVDSVRRIVAILAFGLFAALAAFRMAGLQRSPRFFVISAAGFAVASFCLWSNLFQFHYGSIVHRHEFFHYYLGAKYLPELGYTKLYRCAVVAQVQESSLFPPSEVPKTIRNLESNELERTDYLVSHPEICTGAFSEVRWSSFKSDLRWFWGQLNDVEYSRALLDHGFNATPVWSIAGSFLANLAPASSLQIYALGLLDIMLLSITWIICWRTFGLFSVAAAVIFWGTNAIANFAWTGNGFLRADWLVCLLLGICALKVLRFGWGGAFLMASGLLRIFPFAFFLAALISIAYAVRGKEDRSASIAVLKRFILGAGLILVISLPLSLSVTGGTVGWQQFFNNTYKHMQTQSTNMVGLPVLLASDSSTWSSWLEDGESAEPLGEWMKAKRAIFQSRKPVYYLIVGFIVLMFVCICCRSTVWEAAVYGALPISAISLSNYDYYFLLPFGLLFAQRPLVSAGLLCLGALSWPLFDLTQLFDQRYFLLGLSTQAFLIVAGLLQLTRGAGVGNAVAAPADEPE